jgi:alpha-N-acetylglucosaminidase
MGKNISGVGAIPEGIGTIPVVYDMVFDMAWRTDSIDVPQWISEYVRYRYHAQSAAADSAWQILARTIYECHNETGGPVESYICARPADELPCVSSWGNAKIFYDPADIVEAWRLMREAAADINPTSDTYHYDMVDLTRQVLGDHFKQLHAEAVAAWRKGDKQRFANLSAQMLELIADDDALLATRPEFNVATWIAEADKAGSTPQEKQQFVANAKRQITTWSHLNTALHDYAHKEWSGLMGDLYLQRWTAWRDYKLALLNGEQPAEPDYFEMEDAWVNADKTYPPASELRANAAEGLTRTFDKYYQRLAGNK